MTGLARAFRAVMSGAVLSREACRGAFEEMLGEGSSDVLTAALLAALARRGEAPSEVAGVVDVLRDRAVRLPLDEAVAASAIDVCGTGGDGLGTFNVSTATAFVVAGAGVPVAKHGNRAVSSACGSADVLSALGVRIDMPLPLAARALAEARMTFLFAPAYHGAMKRVAGLRRELGVRTVFNLAGPLANPARVARQLVGVDRPERIEVLAEALLALGTAHALVVSHEGGGDEILPFGVTRAAEVSGGAVRRLELTASDFGLPEHSPEALAGGDAATNAGYLRALLDGEKGPRRDTVLMNAAAALVVAGAAPDFRTGVARAEAALDGGTARGVLTRLVALSAEAL